MKKLTRVAKPKGRNTVPKTLRAPAGNGVSETLSPASAVASGPFANAGVISNDGVLTILSGGFEHLMSGEFLKRTVIADNEYLETPPEFVINAIVTDPILSPKNYHAEIFDCDDYVMYLKTKMSLYAAMHRLQAPLAVGCLFTTEHAYTICIDRGASLFLINTQSTDHAVTNDSAGFRGFLGIRPGNIITAIYL